MREPNPTGKSARGFAEFATSSLRKGIPTSRVDDSLKRKEDSSRFPSRRVAVSLRCRAPPTMSFWNFNQIPFRWYVVFSGEKTIVRERLPPA
jgi:hypothetical protein